MTNIADVLARPGDYRIRRNGGSWQRISPETDSIKNFLEVKQGQDGREYILIHFDKRVHCLGELLLIKKTGRG